MTEYFKTFVVPLVVQVLVGLGAASLTIATFNARIETRMTHIEMRAQEHDQKLESLRTRSEEQGRKLARFEAVLADIAEIKGDVKTLLRGTKK